MLLNLAEAMVLSEKYEIPTEDILFLDLSLSGIRCSLPYIRIRFDFTPADGPWFSVSRERNVSMYFFALPVTTSSAYYLDKEQLTREGEVLGRVQHVEEDTCDSSYLRRKGTALVLNPVSKSLCHGCGFCHTSRQTARDKISLLTEPATRQFIERWLTEHNLPSFTHLIQVSIVTGCFGEEAKVLGYLHMIRRVLKEYGFQGLLLYYGSEITSTKALDELREISPIELCISVECFTERQTLLRPTKGKLTMEDIQHILARVRENGSVGRFSYILGLEPLDVMEAGFESLLPYASDFPVINIFQAHRNQKLLRHPEASTISYYLKARKMVEEMFAGTNMRPKPWENYRSLWHLNFGKEVLNDIRTPY